MTMTAPSGSVPAEADQRLSTPAGQAQAWFRLLLAMTIPILFLLIGISLTR
jgi:hypothetical protein